MTGKDGTNNLEASLGGGGCDKHPGGIPGEKGRMGQPPCRHPWGGGGANTLLQPHWP